MKRRAKYKTEYNEAHKKIIVETRAAENGKVIIKNEEGNEVDKVKIYYGVKEINMVI